MRRTRQRKRAHLFDLFTPVPTRPSWSTLPEPVQRKVTTLLADLLRARRVVRLLPARRKEADDE